MSTRPIVVSLYEASMIYLDEVNYIIAEKSCLIVAETQ